MGEQFGSVKPKVEPDGRRRRGQAQRARILEGTLDVIARHGLGGVSQRAVAAQAGVSAASVFYYFSSIDELLAATLRSVNTRYVADLRRVASAQEDGFTVLADVIAAVTTTSRRFAIAELELYLRAIRDPRLRDELDSWWTAVEQQVSRHVDDPQLRTVLVAAVDGLFLRQLAARQPMDRDAIRAVLMSVFGSTAAPEDTPAPAATQGTAESAPRP